MTLDHRDSPEVREAMDQAAREAEWLLDHHNGDAARELALDILNDYVGGIDRWLSGGYTSELRDPGTRLAWAFALTEQRTDLKPHEQRLLDEAWEVVRKDAQQRAWEEMGKPTRRY